MTAMRPEEAIWPSAPPLAEGEVRSLDVSISFSFLNFIWDNHFPLL